MFVLDASAALSFLFIDERDTLATRMLNALVGSAIYAPQVFRSEIMNALLSAERSARLTAQQVNEMYSDIGKLSIALDDGASTMSQRAELEVARKYGLTAYDAAYLELAVRKSSLLMTRDEKLTQAARSARVLWRGTK